MVVMMIDVHPKVRARKLNLFRVQLASSDLAPGSNTHIVAMEDHKRFDMNKIHCLNTRFGTRKTNSIAKDIQREVWMLKLHFYWCNLSIQRTKPPRWLNLAPGSNTHCQILVGVAMQRGRQQASTSCQELHWHEENEQHCKTHSK